MCTLTWLHEAAGYTVFFNRDERRTRKPAVPPSLRGLRGVGYIAPADGDAGGSWIGANEFGVTLCLLNLYERQAAAPPPGDFTSRGLLLLDLMDSPTSAAARGRLAGADLAPYQPFTLTAFEPDAPALVVRWDGRALRAVHEASPPLVSSSYDPAGVARVRGQQFRELTRRLGDVDAEDLAAFHRSHAPARGAYSPCMHRDDAETVSFTRVRVDASAVFMAYQEGAPCARGPIYSAELARRSREAAGEVRP
jgi:hypothetical protein